MSCGAILTLFAPTPALCLLHLEINEPSLPTTPFSPALNLFPYVTMGNPKVFASEVLALVARRAAIVLHRHAVQNVSASAAAIAGRLLYIADELSNHEPNQLQSDMQSLSLQALQDLVDICNVYHVSGDYDNEL